MVINADISNIGILFSCNDSFGSLKAIYFYEKFETTTI